jgi:FlaA1/EpsC-like NDP-sugar epimerase
VVFHAAAYKHVPMLEKAVREAVRNNIFGTVNLLDVSEKYHPERFIFISTDKAVNPVNVLGVTKRIGELYTLSKNIPNTIVSVVRFGNVLGSNGSVIPMFQEQIRQGGPITVTHPDINRYFMTIQESCQLILQSAVMGQGGEIFILDMGNPVRILYLAEQMIQLSGKQDEIKISITGLRPGEKITEELFYDDEKTEMTGHKKIMLARNVAYNQDKLNAVISRLKQASIEHDQDTIQSILNEFMSRKIKLNNIVKLQEVKL